jgi:hypothetical protein
MENASAAFLDAVRKSMRAIRTAIGATSIDPDLLTRAERLQYEGYLRREEANAAIMGLSREGFAIKEIVRARGTVEDWSVRSCAGSEPTCSGSARTRSMSICPSSTRNGPMAATTVPSSGDA